MTPLAVDTSVAIPLLVATHEAHAGVTHRWKGRDVATRDARAKATYETVGVGVVVVG